MLADAAELRAGGASWDSIASQLRLESSAVRQWPRMFPDRWIVAQRAAEAQVATEAAAESVFTLRQQLRSRDPKVSREAAHKLIQYRVAMDRTAADSDPADLPSSEAMSVAHHLESLTHDQREQLLDRALSVLSARRNPRPAGGDADGA
jgi:hypothetical protein